MSGWLKSICFGISLSTRGSGVSVERAEEARRQLIWDHTPGGNVEHVEEHDLTIEDVDHVLANPEATDKSRSSGLPCVFGYTPDSRYIIVVYEEIDADTVTPVTAC